ncbi:putative BRICK1 [Klebsormidium nitens]|uniref:Putative BRICK1 n=1 Tax=Klebsormidium nitens TaxID=105231 RepID=A0A1Y1HWK5_KLENI|nr:putative BRICK1 [Klebsormidium nitens]|eukprot:GAQ81361.1 putative BRICK1 [Klebsormidium nitens]
MSEEVSAAVREDWDNREFADQLKLSIAQLFEFLARFEASTRDRLAQLAEKMTSLEGKMELLEAQQQSLAAPPR